MCKRRSMRIEYSYRCESYSASFPPQAQLTRQIPSWSSSTSKFCFLVAHRCVIWPHHRLYSSTRKDPQFLLLPSLSSAFRYLTSISLMAGYPSRKLDHHRCLSQKEALRSKFCPCSILRLLPCSFWGIWSLSQRSHHLPLYRLFNAFGIHYLKCHRKAPLNIYFAQFFLERCRSLFGIQQFGDNR